jgi:drug/metabolite transporter (DMT)-like permease
VTPFAWLLIIVAIASLVAGELLLKHAMESTHARGYRQRTFVLFLVGGMMAMAVYFFLTLGLLQRFDLSFLYPFEGLSVIFIGIAAALLLKEHLTKRLVIGSLLITAGVVLVSFS